MSTVHTPEMVTINSPGHHLHNTQARVFHKHDDGRVNVQVIHSPKKGHVSNFTLKQSQFVKGVVDLEAEKKNVKEDNQLDEIKMSDDEFKRSSDLNGPRAAKLLKHSWSQHDVSKEKQKAGDTEGAAKAAATGSRAHKLYLKATQRHLKNPANAEKHARAMMSGASAYYASKKPGQYTGDSYEPQGEMLPEMIGANAKVMGVHDYFKKNGDYYKTTTTTPKKTQDVNVAPVAKQHQSILNRIKSAQKTVSQKLTTIKKMNEGTSAAIRMQRALEKIRAERERSERRGQELMDTIKKQQAAEKAAKPVQEESMKSLSAIMEQAGKSVHPDAIHVQQVKVNGQTKYKVHDVGKNFSHGVKTGEHLSDTELDDFSEMGGKVKHVK